MDTDTTATDTAAPRPDADNAHRERAYAIWEREGRPDDRHLEHWEAARLTIDDAVDRADAGPTETPVGTKGEREVRGGGDEPIPAAAPEKRSAAAR